MEENSMHDLLEAIEVRARTNGARVAMGIRDPNPKLLESARKPGTGICTGRPGGN